MTTISNPQLKDTVVRHFADQSDDAAPTWVEIHGLLCAFAVGPYEGPGDFGAALDMPLPEPVAGALAELRARLLTDTLAGERITLPCLLDPYKEDDGNDLACWCAGFLGGTFVHAQRWFDGDEEDTMANWLLPMLLISGIDDDPELDEIWQLENLVRQMAQGIPDILEEMLLRFQGAEG